MDLKKYSPTTRRLIKYLFWHNFSLEDAAMHLYADIYKVSIKGDPKNLYEDRRAMNTKMLCFWNWFLKEGAQKINEFLENEKETIMIYLRLRKYQALAGDKAFDRYIYKIVSEEDKISTTEKDPILAAFEEYQEAFENEDDN